MGHYRADLACETCGEMRCICPRSADTRDNHWVVGDEYAVMTAREFEDSCGVRRLGFFERMQKTHHPERHDAEVEARESCEAAVEATRAQLTYLKNVLKVQRPWEKK